MSHVDSSTDAILAQLIELRATLDTQQAAIEALQAENAHLRAALDAEPATLADLSPAPPEAAAEAAVAAESAGVHESQPHAGLTSRRGLLRGAAAATAAATVGAVALGGAQPAHAAPLANGDFLILGQSNSETLGTTLSNTTPATAAVFTVSTTNTDYHYPAILGISQNGASGVAGVDNTSSGVGVYGHSLDLSGVGVKGETLASGTGVWGEVESSPGAGTGVAGGGIDGVGVLGYAASGWGVAGESNIGYDFVANGTGILGINVQGSVGAPTSGYFVIGDCIRDANGELWLCTAGDGTSVGTWVKVAHLAPGATSGGAITYLSKPIRLLDTRSGATAAHTPGSPYLANTTHTISVAGLNFQGVQVPATCAGAIGNLTVLGLTGQGNWVTLTPAGAGFSGTSNINFVGGQLDSNFYNVGLTGGSLDVIMGVGTNNTGGNANIILDLYAVIS